MTNNKHKAMQFIIQEWKKATGKNEIDMHEVAEYAIAKRGWPPPEPISAAERLAREFSQAAREATRQDGKTGHEYRVYHAVKIDGKGQGAFFWVDIDESPTAPPLPGLETVKNPAAVALGRLGGLKGGKARAEALSKKKRAEIARIAASARWKKS